MHTFSKIEFIKNKILSSEVLKRTLALWQFKQEKVVFTNGCFDILHRGHVEYLNQAANLGDVLIVGLNSDASVKKLNKGNNRPIQDEYSRALIIASLHYVDAVVIFNDETPYSLIQTIKPHVLVKGGDWKLENIVGYDILQSYGGEVTTIPYLPGFSTTNIEQKIQSFS